MGGNIVDAIGNALFYYIPATPLNFVPFSFAVERPKEIGENIAWVTDRIDSLAFIVCYCFWYRIQEWDGAGVI